ncbi:MAG: inner membrane protein [Gammaproteobacteria bacterium]|jgi:inner membrane protein
MFIGHLPGGYLVARTLWRDTPRAIMVAALIGSVLPDIDLLWFYFVDQRAVHHHEYITHRPAVWAALAAIGTVFHKPITLALGVGGLVHMALDSIAGAIAWGWPFSDVSRPLVVVPATHDHWVNSFLNHWTFQVEIALTLLALFVAIKSNFGVEKKA